MEKALQLTNHCALKVEEDDGPNWKPPPVLGAAGKSDRRSALSSRNSKPSAASIAAQEKAPPKALVGSLRKGVTSLAWAVMAASCPKEAKNTNRSDRNASILMSQTWYASTGNQAVLSPSLPGLPLAPTENRLREMEGSGSQVP